MALKSALPLLLLLSGLQADTQKNEVRAMVGSDVELGCFHTTEENFDLNNLYVYWQIGVSGTPKTVTYLFENSSVGHDNNEYKDRAQMSLDRIKRGDFSLHLYNITPQDEQTFHCLVIRNLVRIVDIEVTLHVAANYSMPVVIPSNTSQDEELTFTCMSKDGYPEPKVYWINKTDNSLLDEALQNSTVFLNPRGLYDVVSVLTIRRVPNMNVGCCIENVLLHQNLTVSSQTALANKTNTSIPEKFNDTRMNPGHTSENTRTVLTVLVVLGVAVAVVVAMVFLWHRSRWPHWNYAGPQASRPELELTDHI